MTIIHDDRECLLSAAHYAPAIQLLPELFSLPILFTRATVLSLSPRPRPFAGQSVAGIHHRSILGHQRCPKTREGSSRDPRSKHIEGIDRRASIGDPGGRGGTKAERMV
jgi:hypothetical protein